MEEKQKDTTIEDVLKSMEEGFKKYVKPQWEEIEKCRVPTLSGRNIYILPKQNPYPVNP
jgi:hypothetical protein